MLIYLRIISILMYLFMLGVAFFPVTCIFNCARLKDVKDGGKFGSHAVVSYPVSADLDHFTAYMKDMGSLKFEIFTSDTATKPAGLAEIPDIFNLSPGKPVNGYDVSAFHWTSECWLCLLSTGS